MAFAFRPVSLHRFRLTPRNGYQRCRPRARRRKALDVDHAHPTRYMGPHARRRFWQRQKDDLSQPPGCPRRTRLTAPSQMCAQRGQLARGPSGAETAGAVIATRGSPAVAAALDPRGSAGTPTRARRAAGSSLRSGMERKRRVHGKAFIHERRTTITTHARNSFRLAARVIGEVCMIMKAQRQAAILELVDHEPG